MAHLHCPVVMALGGLSHQVRLMASLGKQTAKEWWNWSFQMDRRGNDARRMSLSIFRMTLGCLFS